MRIQCSLPRCGRSVSAPNASAVLDLARRMGYVEDGADGKHWCPEHAPPGLELVDDDQDECNCDRCQRWIPMERLI